VPANSNPSCSECSAFQKSSALVSATRGIGSFLFSSHDSPT
jgi:hypothetical protein